MQEQIKIIEALISRATSGMNIAETLQAVNVWNEFAKQALDEHEALENIKAEQKAKGKWSWV